MRWIDKKILSIKCRKCRYKEAKYCFINGSSCEYTPVEMSAEQKNSLDLKLKILSKISKLFK